MYRTSPRHGPPGSCRAASSHPGNQCPWCRTSIGRGSTSQCRSRAVCQALPWPGSMEPPCGGEWRDCELSELEQGCPGTASTAANRQRVRSAAFPTGYRSRSPAEEDLDGVVLRRVRLKVDAVASAQDDVPTEGGREPQGLSVAVGLGRPGRRGRDTNRVKHGVRSLRLVRVWHGLSSEGIGTGSDLLLWQRATRVPTSALLGAPGVTTHSRRFQESSVSPNPFRLHLNVQH